MILNLLSNASRLWGFFRKITAFSIFIPNFSQLVLLGVIHKHRTRLVHSDTKICALLTRTATYHTTTGLLENDEENAF